MSSVRGIKPSDLAELSKLKIMIPVSLTGFTGYFMHDPRLTPEIIMVTAGILLMAVSASVLNQLQEIDTDSMMPRTAARPLPSGRIAPWKALVYFFLTLLSGAFLVWFAGGSAALIVSLITIIWYNGVYTYLKRITALAVIPGAFTGALPPLIGWIAAGGDPFDISIILVQVLIFTGQIPHFWLLVLKYGPEYEKAGMPSLTAVMSRNSIYLMIFLFVISFSIITLFLGSYGIVHNRAIFGVLMLLSILLTGYFYMLLRGNRNKLSMYSVVLNTYFLAVMILLITDRMIG
jgi:heme o synthase